MQITFNSQEKGGKYGGRGSGLELSLSVLFVPKYEKFNILYNIAQLVGFMGTPHEISNSSPG